MIYQNPQMIDIADQVRRVARKDRDVPFLILGGTGVGKNVMARFIHEETPGRCAKELETLCLSRDDNLLDAEWFGYKKGAFTGAVIGHDGAFTRAYGGTAFLDEIGDLSPQGQFKLLKVIDDKKYMPIGRDRYLTMDARIIAATNKPLEELQSRTYFREDLYYRLSEEVITIPPLRERAEDIPPLGEYFLNDWNQQHQTTYVLGEDDQSLLLEYSFPGNVRELKQIVESTARHSEGSELDTKWLAKFLTVKNRTIVLDPIQKLSSQTPDTFLSLKEINHRTEREYIKKVLLARGYNTSRVATLLRINRGTLRRKLKLYGLDKLCG